MKWIMMNVMCGIREYIIMPFQGVKMHGLFSQGDALCYPINALSGQKNNILSEQMQLLKQKSGTTNTGFITANNGMRNRDFFMYRR